MGNVTSTSTEEFGFIFSANGISADPKKVVALQQANNLKDPAEIRSLLGIANYYSRFERGVPHLLHYFALTRQLFSNSKTLWPIPPRCPTLTHQRTLNFPWTLAQSIMVLFYHKRKTDKNASLQTPVVHSVTLKNVTYKPNTKL